MAKRAGKKPKTVGLGERLKLSRNRLGLSQTQVADLTGLSVRTVSRLEAGVATGKPRVDAVLKLAHALQEASPFDWLELAGYTGLREKEVQERFQKIGSSGSPVQRDMQLGVSEVQLLESADRYLNALHGPVVIWLIGPKSLPVKSSPYVQNTWIKNLRAGRTYRVLWFLDQLEVGTFGELAIGLAAVSKGAPPDGATTSLGAIEHYAYQLSGVARTEVTKAFDDFKNRLTDKVNKFFERPVEISSDHTRDLSRYWQPFSSLVLYSPTDPVDRPVANICLHDVSAFHDGHARDAFVWLSPSVAFGLDTLVREIYSSVTAGSHSPRTATTAKGTT